MEGRLRGWGVFKMVHDGLESLASLERDEGGNTALIVTVVWFVDDGCRFASDEEFSFWIRSARIFEMECVVNAHLLKRGVCAINHAGWCDQGSGNKCHKEEAVCFHLSEDLGSRVIRELSS